MSLCHNSSLSRQPLKDCEISSLLRAPHPPRSGLVQRHGSGAAANWHRAPIEARPVTGANPPPAPAAAELGLLLPCMLRNRLSRAFPVGISVRLEDRVDVGLISSTSGPKPVDHLRIDTERDLRFAPYRLESPAQDRSCELLGSNLGNIRKIEGFTTLGSLRNSSSLHFGWPSSSR